jgi:hypothetical protein
MRQLQPSKCSAAPNIAKGRRQEAEGFYVFDWCVVVLAVQSVLSFMATAISNQLTKEPKVESTGLSAFCLLLSAFYFRPCALCLLLSAFYFRPCALCLLLSAFYFRPCAFCLLPSACLVLSDISFRVSEEPIWK